MVMRLNTYSAGWQSTVSQERSQAKDCKHFDWENCPVQLAGQFLNKSQVKSIVMEAIVDVDHYFWYNFWGEPGLLNDLNILDKSDILADLHIDKYEIDG